MSPQAETQQTRVGHAIEDGDAIDEYVARGSGRKSMGEVPIGQRGWLGNPYPEAVHGREACIENFENDFVDRILNDDEFADAVAELSGKNLGCFCQTLDEDGPACHAEVIAEWADRLANEEVKAVE